MTVWADADDYEEYSGGTPPANIVPLLRSASGIVTDAIRLAVYDVDTDGDPTDTAVLDALRDATCAQAYAWATLSINPAAGGVVTAGAATSKSLDGVAVAYSGANEAAKARAGVVDQLVPDAERILRQAGLLSSRAWSYG